MMNAFFLISFFICLKVNIDNNYEYCKYKGNIFLKFTISTILT